MEHAHVWTVDLVYLAASVLFVLGLKGLTRPRTAVRGNLLGALGMLLAVLVTLSIRGFSWGWIVAGLGLGIAVGTVLALRIRMTAMPQLVALFNGFGGAASALVAGAELWRDQVASVEAPFDRVAAMAVSGLVGSVAFSGSLVAFAKLQELVSDAALILRGRQFVNAAVAALTLLLAAWVVSDPQAPAAYWLLLLTASLLGVLLVMAIGGADMPVVIALLNSYSGLAAAATGFVLSNNVLIIAGALVGASGLILTRIMCQAMNRSLANVLFGVLAPSAEGATADEDYAGRVKSTSPEEVAVLLESARRVLVVPGYGMAVAQCQHAVRDLAALLAAHGTKVQYAIHPVAGRMPGHMNVLLAEANIAYDDLLEMDDANRLFEQTDVALVIGANDVVNPLARTDPTSPIAGMPILDVDKAHTVVIIKRSLSPGFAGIPNPLFAADNALMLFGDAQKMLAALIAEVKEIG